MTQRLECSIRRGKLLAIIILVPFPAAAISALLGFKAASLFGDAIGISISVFIATLFSLFWLRCWYNLLFRRIVLIINEFGIEDRRIGVGVIAWADIERISLIRGRDEPHIVIHVHQEAKSFFIMPFHQRLWIGLRQLIRMNSLRNLIGVNPLIIDCFALTPDFNEIWSCINAYYGHSKRTIC